MVMGVEDGGDRQHELGWPAGHPLWSRGLREFTLGTRRRDAIGGAFTHTRRPGAAGRNGRDAIATGPPARSAPFGRPRLSGLRPDEAVRRGLLAGAEGRGALSALHGTETRYAKSGETSVAYQVVGDGPIDLVHVSGFLSHLEWNWQYPPVARFLERLASFSRLILLDKRGTGLSDPVDGVPTLEERMDDVRAVMDAVGSERAALLGVADGGPLCLLFAATYPERTSALALYASLAKFTQDHEYPWGWTPAGIQLYLTACEADWGTGVGAEALAPSLAGDESYRHWFARLLRLSASPRMALGLLRMNTEVDVRPVLSSVRAPTLVLHRTGDLFVSLGHGTYLAERIPGAAFVELPGHDHWPWAGDAGAIVSHVQELTTGVRWAPQSDRVLTTVLFTDVVGSTERAAALGDRRWRDVLEGHCGLVRRELERFRGREINTAGDGFLAAFEGPGRAIRCAAAIVEGSRAHGVEIRAGIHTGECESQGDCLAGIAVHWGARVAAQASPGEILVSRVVRDLVAGSGIEFDDRGLFALKGIPGRQHLFAARSAAPRSAVEPVWGDLMEARP
jgi:class 3 adenylate cyclase/pimeloyl-ACP methyl ester carboxylesterase